MKTNPLIVARESIGCARAIDFIRKGNVAKVTVYKAEIGAYPNIPLPYIIGLFDLGFAPGGVTLLKADYAEWLEEKKAVKG